MVLISLPTAPPSVGHSQNAAVPLLVSLVQPARSLEDLTCKRAARGKPRPTRRSPRKFACRYLCFPQGTDVSGAESCASLTKNILTHDGATGRFVITATHIPEPHRPSHLTIPTPGPPPRHPPAMVPQLNERHPFVARSPVRSPSENAPFPGLWNSLRPLE